MPNPNLELLELAAERLRQLLPESSLLAAAATGPLINDPPIAPKKAHVFDPLIAAGGTPQLER